MKLLTELINAARSSFLQASPDPKPLKTFKCIMSGDSYCVFGIEKDAQSREIIQSARSIVLKAMNLPEHTSIIQVIGDSANFQDDRIDIAKKFLHGFLNKYPQALILYGLTGHSNRVSNQYDANGLVSAWIDQNPIERGPRVLGNVVDYHTPHAIESWGCSVGDVRNIFLVYAKGEPSAKFGDDVLSSDYIVKSEDSDNEDFCLCLEGGVQSFNQVVRLLNENVKVFALKGIRGEQNPACFDKEKKQFISYFSATEFLSIIKAVSLKNPNLNKEAVNEILASYIYNPTKDGEYNFTNGKRLYANSMRADFSTKAALMESSLKEFIEQETWKKLDLLTVVDYKELSQHFSKDAVDSHASEEDKFSVDLITKFSSIYNFNSKLAIIKNRVSAQYNRGWVNHSCKLGFFAVTTVAAVVTSYYALNLQK